MNKVLIALLFVSAVLTSGCADQLAADFNVEYDAEYLVESGTITGTTFNESSDPIVVETDDFDDSNAELEKLESAKLSECTITIVNPTTEDLSFANNISLYITGDGLEEELIASKMPIDGSQNSVSLDVEDLELATHLKTGTFVLRAEGTTAEDVDVDLTFRAYLKFAVKASIL
jgi:hypothetical protein